MPAVRHSFTPTRCSASPLQTETANASMLSPTASTRSSQSRKQITSQCQIGLHHNTDGGESKSESGAWRVESGDAVSVCADGSEDPHRPELRSRLLPTDRKTPTGLASLVHLPQRGGGKCSGAPARRPLWGSWTRSGLRGLSNRAKRSLSPLSTLNAPIFFQIPCNESAFFCIY